MRLDYLNTLYRGCQQIFHIFFNYFFLFCYINTLPFYSSDKSTDFAVYSFHNIQFCYRIFIIVITFVTEGNMKKKIAVFSTGWCYDILTQFLTGLKNEFAGKDADLFLFTCYPAYVDTDAHRQGELNILSLPNLKDFDATVIFGSGLGYKEEVDDIIERSNAAGIPVIMQGAQHDDAYFIGSDNYDATIDMCRHLCEKHDVNSMIFFAGTADSYDSELRLKAVRDYLKSEGRSEDLKDVLYTKWENAVVTRYINALCAENMPLPDVFICANDGLAMETCLTLSANGYEVPGDVLVTGYDHINDSQVFDPSIASVDQCFTQMGEACGNMLLNLIAGKPCDRSVSIPSKFFPDESCNCYDGGNGDKMRRRLGREAFRKRAANTYFNRKLNNIDSAVLSSASFPEFCNNLHDLFLNDHDFEGDSFHILLEPNFGLSIDDPTVKLGNKGYSTIMDILYSMEDGNETDEGKFISKCLIPGYRDDSENHLYIFLPIHESDEVFGYIVFKDCLNKLEDHLIQNYQSRMSLIFDKFRYALSLDNINRRLLKVMSKDPLTNVNNRRAYDDKEVFLQSEINSGTGLEFAIAMFDINNLKTINDTIGHEAGDAYLKRACRLICEIFKHSPVYRIGGDEFVAILTGHDYDHREELLRELESCLSPYRQDPPLPDDYISIATGVAEFIPGTDKSVQDIRNRADDLMYKNKALIKRTE